MHKYEKKENAVESINNNQRFAYFFLYSCILKLFLLEAQTLRLAVSYR